MVDGRRQASDEDRRAVAAVTIADELSWCRYVARIRWRVVIHCISERDRLKALFGEDRSACVMAANDLRRRAFVRFTEACEEADYWCRLCRFIPASTIILRRARALEKARRRNL